MNELDNHAPSGQCQEQIYELIDEFSRRITAGQPVSIDQFVREHSEHADILRDVLPAISVLNDLSSGSKDATQTNDAPMPEALGDFRLIREIGRGGMGIVYEAEQLSLGRRVAVKVLPFTGVLNGNQLQRFKTEAQAAASLHHPNIVNAFFVGHQRGVHYYAMRLVDGQSLADIIHSLRNSKGSKNTSQEIGTDYPRGTAETAPVAALSTAYVSDRSEFYRAVVQLFVHAADALSYAHSMGIVHRDIKPSNLLIDQDGVLWITDFGLAATQTDTNLTLTGDLLGTLRYMSPERAIGENNADPRTDIYSLGATLYELILLHPVIPGDSRAELLRQLAEEDPAAPRSLDPEIPRDLEKVLLKSLAKLPFDRYASAAAMADDLRRFLDDKPVLAQPPSDMERVLRWARRNRSFSAMLTVSLLLLLTFAIGGPLVALKLHSQQIKATESAELAKENLRRHQEFLNKTLVHTLSAGEGRPEVVELQRKVLRETIRFYKAMPELTDDPQFLFDMAVAYGDMAVLNGAISASPGESDWLREQRCKILRQLMDEYDTFEYRYEFAKSMYHRIREASVNHDVELARSLFKESDQVNRTTIAKYPGRHGPGTYLCLDESQLALILFQAGHLSEAEEHARRSVATFENILTETRAYDIWAGAEAYDILANIRAEQNRLPAAKREASKLLQLSKILLGNDGLRQQERTHARYFVGVYQITHATMLHCLGEVIEAEDRLRKTVASRERLRDEFPHYTWGNRVWKYERFSDVLLSAGKTKEAEESLRTALVEIKKKDDPSMDGWLRFRLGQILWRTGRTSEATEAFGQAEHELKSAAEDEHAQKRHSAQQRLAVLWTTCLDPARRRPEAALDLMQSAHTPGSGGSWQILALAHYRAGDWPKASDSLFESTNRRQGGDPSDQLLFAMIHAQIGNREEAVDFYGSACEGLENRVPISFGVGVVRNRQDVLDLKSEVEVLLEIESSPASSEAARPRTDQQIGPDRLDKANE